MPKAAVAFTGCKLNRYEIQAISESLERNGFDLVPFDKGADLYVINTCGVTGRAEASSRQMIRRARGRDPHSKIVVTGCYSQLKASEAKELGADLVVSNESKERLPDRIAALFESRLVPSGRDPAIEFGEIPISGMGDLTRGFVKIQEGCDRKCSYCTIWISRGPVRSRKPEYIIREIDHLNRNGYLEIVLTGVHIGLYDYGRMGLTGLLEMILNNTNIPRIRLSSLYPTEIDERLIGLMNENPRICPHVHLSTQSGDDRILRAMGRRYTRQTLFDVVARLRSAIPKITVGADIIVGFPGESDDSFINTLEFVKTAPIDHLHVFPFSPRPGTVAAEMTDRIPENIKRERVGQLKAAGKNLKNRHLRNFIGRNLQALLERREWRENGLLTGLTENYLRVQAIGAEHLKGKLVPVIGRGINRDTLLCDLID